MNENYKSIEFGSPKWKEEFYRQKSLTSIIDSTDIKGYEFHRIEKTYTVNDDRVGAIVQIQKDGKKKRAIIDFKRGDSTWDQLIDMKFSIGSSCDYFIAVYDNSWDFRDENNNTEDGTDSESLVECFAAYGVKTYLVSASREVSERRSLRHEYSCFFSIEEYTGELISEKLPTKRQFQHAEFMMSHRNVYGAHNSTIMLNPEDWNFGDKSNLIMFFEEMDEIDIFSNWSDSALFMNVVAKSDKGVESLEWIWVNKRKELQQEYKDCKIRLYKKDGRPSKISVRILGIGFNELQNLTYSEKSYCGRSSYIEEHDFSQLIEDFLSDMPVNK